MVKTPPLSLAALSDGMEILPKLLATWAVAPIATWRPAVSVMVPKSRLLVGVHFLQQGVFILIQDFQVEPI